MPRLSAEHPPERSPSPPKHIRDRLWRPRSAPRRPNAATALGQAQAELTNPEKSRPLAYRGTGSASYHPRKLHEQFPGDRSEDGVSASGLGRRMAAREAR